MDVLGIAHRLFGVPVNERGVLVRVVGDSGVLRGLTLGGLRQHALHEGVDVLGFFLADPLVTALIDDELGG